MNKLIKLDNNIAIFLKLSWWPMTFNSFYPQSSMEHLWGWWQRNRTHSGFAWCVLTPLHLKVYSNLRQWIEVTVKEKRYNPTSLCVLSQLHLTSRECKIPGEAIEILRFLVFQNIHTCFALHWHTYYRYISREYMMCILWINVHINIFSTLCLMWVLDGVHF